MNSKSMLLKLLALLFAFTLVAAACGDDDDGDSASDDSGESDDGSGDDGSGDDGSGDDGSGDDDSVELTQAGAVLEKVTGAGTLECGGNDTLPGFGIVDADGGFSGFDIDFCKVIAAAVLGDSEAINITPLVPAQRFPTLQSGEIDVLIRNTTWTASRDGNEQANFLHTTFFDGQGFMVRADSGITSLADVANASICVLQGTTTLLNMNAVLGDLGIPFTAVEFESNDELNPAFVAGQCEVWTSDASQLASFAAGMDIETVILPEIISKEPLGPVVADGDTQWAQIVNWATMATIQAWEFGIDSTNIDSFADSEDSNIRRFLGLPITDDDGNEAVAEVGLGLPTDFATQIITQVGNYKEIYDRNLNPLGLSLEGTPNDLWTNGGLQYVPPYR
ncbi:MAG: amino acid ABC transporter substrate-binding protein [Acidimicrobiales bacterium]